MLLLPEGCTTQAFCNIVQPKGKAASILTRLGDGNLLTQPAQND